MISALLALALAQLPAGPVSLRAPPLTVLDQSIEPAFRWYRSDGRILRNDVPPEDSGETPPFLAFATSSGVGMSAECACTNITGTSGEPLTHSRASSAYCTPGNFAEVQPSTMVSCGNNLPRVTTGGTGNRGLLIERAYTPLVLHSESFDNAAWTGSATVTADSTTSPSSSPISDADTITDSNAGALHCRSQTIATTAQRRFVASVYLRQGTISNATVSITGTGNSAGNCSVSVTNLTTPMYRRISCTSTNAYGAALTAVTINVCPGATAAETGSIIAWGANLSDGADELLEPSSYVGCAGSCTARAAEFSTLPYVDATPTAGSMSFDVRNFANSHTNVGIMGMQGSGAFQQNMIIFGGAMAAYVGQVSKASVAIPIAGQHRMGMNFDATGTTIFDNAATASGAAGTPGAVDSLRLGSYQNADANVIYPGLYKNVCADKTRTRCGQAPAAGLDFSFAPPSGAGMIAACSTGTITDSSGTYPLQFTRAGTAFCTKGSRTSNIQPGDMVLMTTNQPRVMPLNPDGTGPLGLALEAEAENQRMLYSENLAGAAWSTTNSVTAAPTITTNQALAPDNAMTADRLQVPDCSGGATNYSVVQQTVTSAATANSWGVYLRGVSGPGTIGMSVVGAGNNGFTSCSYTDTGYSLCKINITAGANVSSVFRLGCMNAVYGGTSTGAADVYVWGAMENPRAELGTYMPSQGSIETRVAETAQFNIGSGELVVANGYCTAGTINPFRQRNYSGGPTVYLNSANLSQMYQSNSTTITCSDNSSPGSNYNATRAGSTFTAGTSYRAGCVYTGTTTRTLTTYYDGVAGTPTTTTSSGAYLPTSIRLVGVPNSTDSVSTGVISNVRVTQATGSCL